MAGHVEAEEDGDEGQGRMAETRPFASCSSLSDDSGNCVDPIAEITDLYDCRSLSTSAVLSACKQKVLKPYLRLLAVVGFRSVGTDGPNASRTSAAFGHLHLAQVIAFTVLGHVLQCAARFRRDRGFSCESPGESYPLESTTFGLILPCLLHFLGYVYVLYLFRFKETEQLENLMERTFLLSAHRANGRKVHLVKNLWIFISVSILWVMTSLVSVTLLVLNGNGCAFDWLRSGEYKIALDVILVAAMGWQDVVQATVVTSYCLQVQLLSSCLYFLREKLLQHTIQPLSWIREINECQNVLNYLNRDFSPGVCIFIFLDVSWLISSSVWYLKKEYSAGQTSIAVAAGLWLVAALAPFVLAARVTSAGAKLRHSGHEVRIRPFVYQDTPGEDLDTILLYSSTLKMKSKLFSIPVSGPCLCACFALIALSVLVAGQTCLL